MGDGGDPHAFAAAPEEALLAFAFGQQPTIGGDEEVSILAVVEAVQGRVVGEALALLLVIALSV